MCTLWISLGTLRAQETSPTNKPMLKFLRIDLGNGITMSLVRIEPGKFMMGSSKTEQDFVRKDLEKERDELKSQGQDFDISATPVERQHEVEISNPFYMGVFEVTQEQFEKVMGENNSAFKGAKLPVDMVSWQDAVRFCKRLSAEHKRTFDLPTEAEWEYACRAGSTEAYHHGKSLSKKQANVHIWPNDDGAFVFNGKPTAIGSYEPNRFGLYDMHGNAAEWCKDWYGRDYYLSSPGKDPQGPEKGSKRVMRGGSWYTISRDCRSASRHCGEPDGRFGTVGFRVVVRVQ